MPGNPGSPGSRGDKVIFKIVVSIFIIVNKCILTLAQNKLVLLNVCCNSKDLFTFEAVVENP